MSPAPKNQYGGPFFCNRHFAPVVFMWYKIYVAEAVCSLPDRRSFAITYYNVPQHGHVIVRLIFTASNYFLMISFLQSRVC